MAGFGILLRKEWLESWRTYRLVVIAALFLFVGISSPLLARYLPEILKAAGGDQLGVVQLPTPTSADAVAQLWKNLAQFGAFAAILLAMGSVAGEKDRGTAAFVLSKPATRGAFLGAKFLTIALVLGLATAVAVVTGWVYTAILFAPPSPGAWFVMGLLAWLGLVAWAAITFLASTVTGSTAAAAGIGFLALLVLSVVAAVPVLGPYLPSGLAAPALAVAVGGPVTLTDVLTPVAATIVLVSAMLAIATWSFRRQEL
jgi:ABC-2 type transport system permease protein